MTTVITQTYQPTWQTHSRNNDSMDSEISYFDPSSTTSTSDSWSGYFDGWDGWPQDHFCPQIVSENTSPARSANIQLPKEPQQPNSKQEEHLLPSACARRRRPVSVRMEGSYMSPMPRPVKKKRFGIVPLADTLPGEEAISQLNQQLEDSMSNTEDLLAAMYDPRWDIASLQRWYEQSSRTPSDLALFKIMFSLRYTPDEERERERHSI